MSSDDQENLERIDEFARELDSSNAKTPRSFSLRYGSNTPKGEIEGAEPIRKTSARHSVDDKIIDESPTFSKTRKVIVTTGFICATIALLIGSVFYSYSTSSAEYRYLKSSALASLQWPSTTGTITKSKLNYEYDWYTQHAVPYYDPDIAFEYSVKGKSYDGHKISFPNPKFGGLLEGNHFIDNYVVGNKVRVFYNPANPTEACLINGVTHALTTRFLWRLDPDHDGTASR